MPKNHSAKLPIHLDLLKPQSNPEKLHIRFIRWLLSSGRYIFIAVEAVVLLAFIARFKLDADLSANKETISEQIPYIESLKPFETLIRQTQFKLSTVTSFYRTYPDYGEILKQIAAQTPNGVTLTNLTMAKNVAKITVNANGQAQNNNDLAIMMAGLKQDPAFEEVNLTSISFDKGNLNFSLSFSAEPTQAGGKNL